VLDLREVEIINSYGVGKIITCFKTLKNSGGQLMVKPLSGFVKETFDLLMLSNLFPVDND
jgi:anti-anti-sigma factor